MDKIIIINMSHSIKIKQLVVADESGKQKGRVNPVSGNGGICI